MVSVIIPTYNEERRIMRILRSLKLASGDFEVLVADGASSDRTREAVEEAALGFPRRLEFLALARPRAAQLNRAAKLARGEVFCFVHADLRVPATWIEAMASALKDSQIVGGNFRIRFEGESGWNRFFTRAYNVRRHFGIYYGDSGVFIRRDVFFRMDGFKPIPIMDDYEFIRRLERAGRTVCLDPELVVSDRRWRLDGGLHTLLTWTRIQALYSLGVSPERLDRWYNPVREPARSPDAQE